MVFRVFVADLENQLVLFPGQKPRPLKDRRADQDIRRIKPGHGIGLSHQQAAHHRGNHPRRTRRALAERQQRLAQQRHPTWQAGIIHVEPAAAFLLHVDHDVGA